MNWVQDVVVQHNELESPLSFWYWGAVCSISAVVKDQVWLHRQIYNLYPNIYVMLHADSGMKKGPPISMARQLVTHVNNTKVISGRSSIQGILKDMGTGQGHTLPGGKIVKQEKSVVFICSSELSSSIVEDKVAVKILTDLYDRQYNIGEWRSLLKMESFTLKDPTITMFTATNEAMTEDFFTRAAIQGGFTARTFMIYEKEENAVNSLSVPLRNPPDLVKSATYLKQLANLKGGFESLGSRTEDAVYKHPLTNPDTGEIHWFSDAGIIYEEWYRRFKADQKIDPVKDPTGTYNRFGDSVLKVAMLLSLARSPQLIISTDAMNEAITECSRFVETLKQSSVGSKGLSDTRKLKATILKILYDRPDHKISRTMLMNMTWTDYGAAGEFDETVNALEQAGIITYQNLGSHIIIKLPDEQVDKLYKMYLGRKR